MAASPEDRVVGGRAPGEVCRFVQACYEEYERLLRYVAVYIRKHTGDEADELIQEALARLMLEVQEKGPPANPKAWLLAVLKNLSANMARKRSRESRAYGRLSVSPVDPSPAEGAERRALLDAVRTAVRSLPPNYRHALALFYGGEMSVKEVADALTRPESTVKTWLSRAREGIKKSLCSQGWENVGHAERQGGRGDEKPYELG